MRVLILFILMLSANLVMAQKYKLLFWEDLKPQLEFKDPFKDLNLSQLYKLKQLDIYYTREKDSEINLTTDEINRKKEIEGELKSQNVDYEYIFENKDKIIEMRKKQYTGLNTKLDNEFIELSGYLLPLNFNKEKANEFLLVPWVGACIHTPPPPKNQIIFIKSKEWINATTMFEPVLISGQLSVKEGKSNLFLVDGESQIETGYRIMEAKINKL